MKKNVYLGVDVGSVSTNIVIINENDDVLLSLYLRTKGNPIATLKKGIKEVEDYLENSKELFNISGLGTTGSGRNLAGILLGADVVKNEITAHATAAININKEVRTILEIGGQDSKLIILKNGIVTDFAMNTVCAAGTGSFLDRQAERLGIPIEEFGDMTLKSTTAVRIAGRCAVFAESDMIHKQQMGYKGEDIINGLCEALVRNYINNLAKGKELLEPIIFQGGVACNIGIKKAFEKALNKKIIIPKNNKVMGAVGVAILAREKVIRNNYITKFNGFNIIDNNLSVKGFECDGCANVCEIIGIYENDNLIARWGDKCGKWNYVNTTEQLNSQKEKVSRKKINL
jgi:predicted CoA-substrate-specific enzyme activase